MSQFSNIKELIHQYKQYECLWNINCPEYTSSESKQLAWDELASHFQKDVNEVKRKIKYLRLAYEAERKKVEAVRTSASHSYHKPSLSYYNDLTFLDEEINTNEPETTEVVFETAEHSQHTEDDEGLITYVNKGEEELEEVDLKQMKIETETPTLAEPDPLPSQIPLKSYHYRSQKRKFTEENVSIEETNKTAPLPQKRRPLSNNMHLSFGETIALQLKMMPMDVAVLTMSEIQNIVTRKNLEYIRSVKKVNQSSPQSEDDDTFNELIDEVMNTSRN